MDPRPVGKQQMGTTNPHSSPFDQCSESLTWIVIEVNLLHNRETSEGVMVDGYQLALL